MKRPEFIDADFNVHKDQFPTQYTFLLYCNDNFYHRNIETCISKLIVDLDDMEFLLEAADSRKPFLYLCNSKFTTYAQKMDI